ncbi:MAG: phosphate starvation-inducible protein PhoH [Zetaproteobacteria bacterium]|nr:MAG: phosphate starvation-inducible protein PhoH [Zetaproteobacteria bacterium]
MFGEYNDHLSYLEKKLEIHISDRGNLLRISGPKEAINKAKIVLQSLDRRLRDQELSNITHADIDAELRFTSTGGIKSRKGKKSNSKKTIVIKTKNKTIVPRSPNQERYLKLINKHDMVFGLGPAGTGKTYLAVAAGIDMYLQGKVERLIFCRPAVEAGENLGFLPGDMKEKIDPYMRPIYDALQDMLPWDFLTKKMEAGEIEIAPLAFMRGRTLAHSFVILDEAQNTTCPQMKMFLTRMGEASHMVITGDITQTDLPPHVKSGLNDAMDILSDVKDIGFVTFAGEDVIRHNLVRKIICAYESRKK